MIEAELNICFSSDWHCGSGLGETHLSDAVLSRDTEGVPVIPGRAVKGALREGAWRLCLLGGDYVRAQSLIFGSDPQGKAGRQAGRLFVSPAGLPEDIRAFFLSLSHEERRRAVSYLMTRRSRTALQNGVAVRRTLRSLECGVPGVVFRSRLSFALPDGNRGWLLPYMAAVCAAVKSMGADRARGLGRCTLKLTTENGVAVPVPELRDWRMA